jgi:hypothetical protein
MVYGRLAFVVSVVCAAQNGTVETVGPLTDNAVPEGVRQVLDSGISPDADGGACLRVVVGKSVPAQTKKDGGGRIPAACRVRLVGVVHFPQAAADFRDKKFPRVSTRSATR